VSLFEFHRLPAFCDHRESNAADGERKGGAPGDHPFRFDRFCFNRAIFKRSNESAISTMAPTVTITMNARIRFEGIALSPRASLQARIARIVSPVNTLLGFLFDSSPIVLRVCLATIAD